MNRAKIDAKFRGGVMSSKDFVNIDGEVGCRGIVIDHDGSNRVIRDRYRNDRKDSRSYGWACKDDQAESKKPLLSRSKCLRVSTLD